MTAPELPTRGVWTSSDADFSAATSFKPVVFQFGQESTLSFHEREADGRKSDWLSEDLHEGQAWHDYIVFTIWMKASRI